MNTSLINKEDTGFSGDLLKTIAAGKRLQRGWSSYQSIQDSERSIWLY